MISKKHDQSTPLFRHIIDNPTIKEPPPWTDNFIAVRKIRTDSLQRHC